MVIVSLLGLLVAGAALVACDFNSSFFPMEDIYSRRILDHVLAGPESVVSATVYIEPTPGLAADDAKRAAQLADSGFPGIFTSTDASGRFSLIDGPIVYDLTIRKDSHVGVFRHVDRRGWDIPFELDGPVTGFSSILSASTLPAPDQGHSVAYFMGNVVGAPVPVAKSLANGFADVGPAGTLVATYASFTSSVLLWAVEYPTGGTLLDATRKGSLELTLSNGSAASPVVPMTDITDGNIVNTALGATAPPPDYTFAEAEIWIDFGSRRDAHLSGHVKIGDLYSLHVAVGGNYAARLVATSSTGATLDSGRQNFNAFGPYQIQLPSVAVTSSSFDGMRSFTAQAPFTFVPDNTPIGPVDSGTPVPGLFEHVLTPVAAGGTTVDILTPDALAVLPDVTPLGAAQPLGMYTWTTRYYPLYTSTVGFAGADVRYAAAFAATAPQIIVLK